MSRRSLLGLQIRAGVLLVLGLLALALVRSRFRSASARGAESGGSSP